MLRRLLGMGRARRTGFMGNPLARIGLGLLGGYGARRMYSRRRARF